MTHLCVPLANARGRLYQHFYYSLVPQASRGQNKGLVLKTHNQPNAGILWALAYKAHTQ